MLIRMPLRCDIIINIKGAKKNFRVNHFFRNTMATLCEKIARLITNSNSLANKNSNQISKFEFLIASYDRM